MTSGVERTFEILRRNRGGGRLELSSHDVKPNVDKPAIHTQQICDDTCIPNSTHTTAAAEAWKRMNIVF